MLETKDYAKLGQTTFKAQINFDDGDWIYAKSGQNFENQSLVTVERWIEKTLPSLGAGWWVQVKKGTYEDSSFFDEGYGRVADVSWEPDETFDYEPKVVNASYCVSKGDR